MVLRRQDLAVDTKAGFSNTNTGSGSIRAGTGNIGAGSWPRLGNYLSFYASIILSSQFQPQKSAEYFVAILCETNLNFAVYVIFVGW